MSGTPPFLEDLLSADATRIWQASSALLTCWDEALLMALAGHLDEIERATKDVQLGGALHDNRQHLLNALNRIRHVRDHRGCLCQLYGSTQFDDPSKEQSAGHIRIDETVLTEDRYVDHYKCTCLHCGTQYRVVEREYHYTWWGWERV